MALIESKKKQQKITTNKNAELERSEQMRKKRVSTKRKFEFFVLDHFANEIGSSFQLVVYAVCVFFLPFFSLSLLLPFGLYISVSRFSTAIPMRSIPFCLTY